VKIKGSRRGRHRTIWARLPERLRHAGDGYTVDFGDLFTAGDKSRIELLTLELDLAFNFARIAEQYREGPSRERALRCAQIAMGAVRHFEGQISNPTAWRTKHNRADELERFQTRFDERS